jgi:hypothetical protein
MAGWGTGPGRVQGRSGNRTEWDGQASRLTWRMKQCVYSIHRMWGIIKKSKRLESMYQNTR